MKSCRKQNASARQVQAAGMAGARPSAGQRSTAQSDELPAAAAATPVHRYVHPIRTVSPASRRSRRTTEELFTDILESLARQEATLAELLRRTGSEDT